MRNYPHPIRFCSPALEEAFIRYSSNFPLTVDPGCLYFEFLCLEHNNGNQDARRLLAEHVFTGLVAIRYQFNGLVVSGIGLLSLEYEDLVSDYCARILNGKKISFQAGTSSWKSYLATAFRNFIIDRMRYADTNAGLAARFLFFEDIVVREVSESPFPSQLSQENARRILKCMSTPSQQLLEYFDLLFMEEKTPAEVAVIKNVDVQVVYRRQNKIRAILKDHRDYLFPN